MNERTWWDQVHRLLFSVRQSIVSLTASLILAMSYGATLMLCRMLSLRPRRSWSPIRRMLIPATFHNPGWFLSHITPLARSGFAEIIIVTEETLQPMAGVRFACPPAWLTKIFGRAFSKLFWTLRIGVKERPDLYMGYHIIPSALTALVAGRLFSRPVCYQMTGGPVEVEGGGFRQLDNPVMRRIAKPIPWLERLAIAVIGQFDLIVVRGSRAQRFLRDQKISCPIVVIPGSVDPQRFTGADLRPYHMIFVGQLIERKRPLEFIEIVASVWNRMPTVRAAIVGDGPLREQVHERIRQLNLLGQIDVLGKRNDVECMVAQAQVFVLPSVDEGLSIALAEAMMAGVVPVTADVGDLADLVQHGVSGYLVRATDRNGFIHCVETLLHDPELWRRLSRTAIQLARSHNALDRVAAQWSTHLRQTLAAYQTAP